MTPWKIRNTYLDIKEWLWVRLCNPPRCVFCRIPLDKDTSSHYDRVCTFCVERIDEGKQAYADEQPVFERDPFDEVL